MASARINGLERPIRFGRRLGHVLRVNADKRTRSIGRHTLVSLRSASDGRVYFLPDLPIEPCRRRIRACIETDIGWLRSRIELVSHHAQRATRIREVLIANTTNRFPVAEVEAAMAVAGKSLSFDAAEIDELLNLSYGGQRTFSVLSVLYPGLDLSKMFHEDHIFPRSRFTKKKLAAAGVPAENLDAYLGTLNLLPNLQLLAGTANNEKQSTLPADWINSDKVFPTPEKRKTYLEQNDLDGLPLGIADYLSFFEQRRARIRGRLLKALGATTSPAAEQ